MNARWVAPLVALALAGCPPPADAPPVATTAPAAPPAPLPFAWPPERGRQFPDLELRDATGATVRLSRFRGKTLLVEPIGMSCSGCQAFAGGAERGGFGGVQPQQGLPSIDRILEQAGVDPRHPDLVIAQLLLFDLRMQTPTPADAAAWAAHFGLADRPNVVVLVGDDRLREAKGTYDLVPGFFLVDQGGMLLLDATGHQPKDGLVDAVAPTVLELLGGPPAPIAASPRPAAPAPAGAPAAPSAGGDDAPWVAGLPDPATFPDHDTRRLNERAEAALEAGRWAELTKELDALARAGRLPGRHTPRICSAIDYLGRTDDAPGGAEARLERLDAWAAGAPRSAWPWAARAEFYTTWAWDARGGGYADTVTDDGWRLFGERLERARADADEALARDPGCLSALRTRLAIDMGQSAPAPTKAAHFAPVAKTDPPYIDGYLAYFESIMPKWAGGDGSAMWRFAREQVAAHPREPALRLLVYRAHGETARMTDDRKAYERQNLPALQAELDAVLAAYPRSTPTWREKLRLCRLDGDAAKTRAAWLGLADSNDGQYQCAVGERLLEGTDGWPKDPAAALRWIARSAHQGHPGGEARLALWIASGKAGLKADPVAAEAWLARAAEHGDAASIVLLSERLLEPGGDAERARRLLERVGEEDALFDRARALLERARGAATAGAARRSEDGYEDRYPDDISPPRGTRYPCDLTPLPRDLSCLPASERRFVNHVFALLLEATQARLVALRDCAVEGSEGRYAATIASVVRRLKAERVPPGLEPFVSDLLAALDLQVRFHARFSPAFRDELARVKTPRLTREQEGALHARIAEGKQASSHLHASWTKLEVRWGARFTPQVKDSVMHHLCALDIY